MNLFCNATSIPGALMYAALNEQDLLCRVFGYCRAGAQLDREIGSLIEAGGISQQLPKLFTYMRYNADLSQKGLEALGLGHIPPAQVQQMDSVSHISELQQVGRAASKQILPDRFAGFA